MPVDIVGQQYYRKWYIIAPELMKATPSPKSCVIAVSPRTNLHGSDNLPFHLFMAKSVVKVTGLQSHHVHTVRADFPLVVVSSISQTINGLTSKVSVSVDCSAVTFYEV